MVFMIIFLGALNMALYTGVREQHYYPPIPLVIASIGSYEQWVTYYYSNQYLSAIQYVVSQSSYNEMVNYISDSIASPRTLVFNVYRSNTTVMTDADVQPAVLNVYPELMLNVHVYILQQKVSFDEIYRVQIPIRYYIIEKLMMAILAVGPNATAQDIMRSVKTVLAGAQGISVDVVLSSSDNLSKVSLSVRDCYLAVFYTTCPTYLDQAQIHGLLPNLTLSISLPSQP
jgi:hypothetical protein